jgi:hypothetical protein
MVEAIVKTVPSSPLCAFVYPMDMTKSGRTVFEMLMVKVQSMA